MEVLLSRKQWEEVSPLTKQYEMRCATINRAIHDEFSAYISFTGGPAIYDRERIDFGISIELLIPALNGLKAVWEAEIIAIAGLDYEFKLPDFAL